LSAPLSAVRFASGISFNQDTRNQCNNYATNLRDGILGSEPINLPADGSLEFAYAPKRTAGI